MLTSITTVAGLAPLLMEESFQARFLIPMGISIAAGVAFATVLTLVAVPSLYMIVEDFKKALDRVRSAVGLSELRINPDPGAPGSGRIRSRLGNPQSEIRNPKSSHPGVLARLGA